MRDSIAVAVDVDVVCTRPRATPLAMITMRKSFHGSPFLSYIGMGRRFATLRATGAPLYREFEAFSVFSVYIVSFDFDLQENLKSLKTYINSE